MLKRFLPDQWFLVMVILEKIVSLELYAKRQQPPFMK